MEVSRDLRNAKVYYLKFSDEAQRREVEKALKKAGSFLRNELARRISMKFTPRLSFLEDKAGEAEENIERTFDAIEEEHKETDLHEEGTENE